MMPPLQGCDFCRVVQGVTGTFLTRGLPTIGSGRITVPAYFYKVILDYTEPEIKGIGFIMPNEGSQEPLQHFAVTIDSVEKVSGTDFFFQLPDDQEKVLESTVDLSKWSWTATSTRTSKNESGGQAEQCKGTTKKENQCSRMTCSPNGRCWQHGGD
jgi:endonuclease G